MTRRGRNKRSSGVFLGSFSRNSYSNRTKESKDVGKAVWTDLSKIPVDNKTYQDEQIEALLNEWHEKRAVVYNRTGILESHKCGTDCFTNLFVERITADFHLYGCIESGNHHLCKTNSDCELTFTNSESVRLCLYSKGMIDVVIDSNPYGDPEKNRYGSGVGGDDDREGYDVSKGDGDDYLDDSGTLDDHRYSEQLLPLPFGKLLESVLGKESTNDKELSGGENDRSREDASCITTSSSSENTVAMTESLNKTKRLVDSIISGKRDPNAKRYKRRRCFDCEDPSLIAEANAIIKDLLFNEDVRRRINVAREEELRENGRSKVRKYYKRCKHASIRPTIQTVDWVYEQAINAKRLLRVIPLDKELLSKYARVCTQLWAAMLQSNHFKDNKSGYHFNEHVIGTLYTMQVGLKDPENKVSILPEDEFLYNNLPPYADLKYIPPSLPSIDDYKKGDVTNGRNNIKNSINSVGFEFHKRLSLEISFITSKKATI